MAIKNRISRHLPHFYRFWDRYSLISSFLTAIGGYLDESERELRAILRSHWVDTSQSVELDRLGAIYCIKRKGGERDQEYRNRLKTAILSYKGGGTRTAIDMMLRMILRLSPDDLVIIKENPPVQHQEKMKVISNEEWTINPRSIHDSPLNITLSICSPDAKVTDPTIKNLSTGDSCTYLGELGEGDILTYSGDKAYLNKTDVTTRVTGVFPPSLPRARSRWQYSEQIGGNSGSFDKTLFDTSVFAIDIFTEIIFEWTGYEPASFEVILQKEHLINSGLTSVEIQEAIHMIKACGVKAYVRLEE